MFTAKNWRTSVTRIKLPLWKKALYIVAWTPMIAVHISPLPQWVWWLLAHAFGWPLLPTWANQVPGLIPLGLVMVPLALKLYGANSAAWKSILHIWGNDDLPPPAWWLKQTDRGDHGKFVKRFPNFWWFAVRNPVNNSHWWFSDRPANYSGSWASKQMEPADIVKTGARKATRWAYNGIFAGYKVVRITLWPVVDGRGVVHAGKYSEFWIGWKVGSDVPGMGFAMQWRRNREIGK